MPVLYRNWTIHILITESVKMWCYIYIYRENDRCRNYIRLNSQKTPHSSPVRASYGVPFISIREKSISNYWEVPMYVTSVCLNIFRVPDDWCDHRQRPSKEHGHISRSDNIESSMVWTNSFRNGVERSVPVGGIWPYVMTEDEIISHVWLIPVLW